MKKKWIPVVLTLFIFAMISSCSMDTLNPSVNNDNDKDETIKVTVYNPNTSTGDLIILYGDFSNWQPQTIKITNPEFPQTVTIPDWDRSSPISLFAFLDINQNNIDESNEPYTGKTVDVSLDTNIELTLKQEDILEEDSYEPDNSKDFASVFPLGETQERTFHNVDDLDYVTFDAIEGTTYIIETIIDAEADTDTKLYLYNHSMNQLAYNDDNIDFESYISWTATMDGTCYVVVDHYEANIGAYSLKITVQE